VSRLEQTPIECHEGNGLTQLPLQIQAARKLDGIARAERVTQEERTGVAGDLRNHLDDRQGQEVALQSSEQAVAVSGRERHPSRARRMMPAATSTSESRLLAGISEASKRRTVALPVSRTNRLIGALASK
jgi:hypothetical protein